MCKYKLIVRAKIGAEYSQVDFIFIHKLRCVYS